MKKHLFYFICLLASWKTIAAQTPVNMAIQPLFSYSENFADVNNWVFNTTTINGSFVNGIGASAWSGSVVSAIGTVPSAQKITTATTNFQTAPSGGSGFSSGIYKGNQNLIFLATGTTDNNNALCMDLFMNFTGVNAGTLSFDWATVLNSTGNRVSSFKVFATVDGITYLDITAAQVLNLVNGVAANGTIANVALPSIFNNNANAKLRFYFYNGTGGTAGSRPKFSLDNVKVTALPTASCIAPSMQPNNLVFNSVLYNNIQLSFGNATPIPNNYLVVMSTNSSLTSLPVNGTIYNVNDNLGDGTVVAFGSNTSYTFSGLLASTTYYFYIFSCNNICTGGPLYSTSPPLMGNALTLAGALPCVAPTSQATSLVLSNIKTNSITGNFVTSATADEYLIIRTTSPTFTGNINNGTVYNGGNLIGNGSVVTRTTATTFTAASLVSGTTYYFFIFASNKLNCLGGPIYNKLNPLSGNATTAVIPPCVAPLQQATLLNLQTSNNYIQGYFKESASTDGYLIIRSLLPTLFGTPTNATTYVLGATFGTNGTVIANGVNGVGTSFIDATVVANTTYYYHVFSYNNVCLGGPLYATQPPLQGNATTTSLATNKTFFGNLHAHSSYSDGNADSLSLTPADNYSYAKNSLCMDFLGISEHNHSNAGMQLYHYLPGLQQASAATTPNFLALFGMEWGVISSGGHVLVYGSNGLLGWESNNYDTYVAKSNYLGTPETTGNTGLFRTINNIGNNSFATLAHPSTNDFNDLVNVAFNPTADSAIVGSAIASGPAFSTNNTYSDPPFSMGYIDYYNLLLSRGYHAGPVMDHDSHYTNFGRSSNNRLAVTMPTLTSTNFYAAMKSKNFYATEDCDTKIIFTINNQPMGSSITSVTTPSILINAIDPTNTAARPNIKIMYGVAGSGIWARQIAQLTPTTNNSFSFSDFDLPIGTNGYYYADISIAGNRTITSPIWYTKTAITPTTIINYNLVVTNETNIQQSGILGETIASFVENIWQTTNEINVSHFNIQYSNTGKDFITIGKLMAKNKSNNEYRFVDDLKTKNQLPKTLYYRLEIVDFDGKTTYSQIEAINSKQSQQNTTLYPNPAKENITIYCKSKLLQNATLAIYNSLGNIISSKKINLSKGDNVINSNVSSLKSGNYVTVISGTDTYFVNKFIKQ
jgi:trimeric autotransporter adhesin